MHKDDEFFSFTTPNVGFRYSNYGKMLLVTVQATLLGPRVILVHLVTQTTIKMLENSGAPHVFDLPANMRKAIQDYEADHMQKCLNRMDAMFKMREPSERRVQ
jgi:hypothetical protein